MPKIVNIHDAKSNLSRLLAEVEQGKEVIIARAGTPCARLVPFTPGVRMLGAMSGRWPSPPLEFYAPLADDELADWNT